MSAPQVIAVTGASSGIGKATVELFARNGWRVAATMRDPARAPKFDAPAGNIAVVALDVTKPETIAAAIIEIERRLGAIDVLVNNAGYALVGPFEATADAEVRRQIDTNILGLMSVTRAALPRMRERRRGIIINVASMGGRLTFPYYSVYHATKWAVEGFSESLRYELTPFNVIVKIIEPGPINTEFYGRSESRPSDAQLGVYQQHFSRVYRRMQQTGARGANPEVVAAAIWRAATDNSHRLRYTPNATIIMALRHLFGARLFMRGVRRVLRAR